MTWRTVVSLGLLVAAVGAGLYWSRRPPCVTALPAAADRIVDGRAAFYAGVALGVGPAEAPAGLEVIGNPAADRYPDCGKSYARNPWDLIAFQGRLYVGLGDASNEGPSANAGPVPVYAYDPATRTLAQETTLEEERLARFYCQDSTLWVPGDDPRQDWRWGNLYRRDRLGVWQQCRTLPRTIHAQALTWQAGRLFAGLRITDAVPEGVGIDRYGSAVAISSDGGAHWDLVPLGGSLILDFLTVAGHTFAVDICPGPGVQRWLDQEQRGAYHAPLYEYDGSEGFRRRTDVDATVLFPQTAKAGQRAGSVGRAVVWGERAAYVGAFVKIEGELPVRGAYLASNLEPGAVQVERIPLPADALAFDLRLEAGVLEVLFAEPLTEQRWRSTVWSSRDGTAWLPVVSFVASGPARSFERLGDSIYFGLGSLERPEQDPCSPSQDAAGTLLRWPVGS